MNRDSVFISYSHQDAKWLSEVRKHLSILVHNHKLIIWDDSDLVVGSNWKNEIVHSINRCKVAILLVSSDFLASEFIVKYELPRILKAAKKEGVIIFNLILDKCSYGLTELVNFQCFNNPKFPLEELKLADRKRVLVDFTAELLNTVNNAQKKDTVDNITITINEEDVSDFSRVLVLGNLVKRGGQTITDVQSSTLLKRKVVKETLDQLVDDGFVIKNQETKEKKPSTTWKASVLGNKIFQVFDNCYKKL